MTSLAFVIPGPPVPLARARVVNGHAFTPQRSADYKRHVASCARAAITANHWHYGESYAVTVRVYRQARRGDLDNFVKAVLDGMTMANVWQDDKFVYEIHSTMAVDKDNPRVEVEVIAGGEHA